MQKLNRIYENLLRETGDYQGKDLLVVDIQPEYEDGFSYWFQDFIKFINKNYNKFNNLVFYYNGDETVGSMNKQEYAWWWVENGLDEEVIDYAKFYDKGYAFFRNCMDNGGGDEDIANLVRMMIQHNVNDSRDLDEGFWDDYVNEYGAEDIREILEMSEDCINIPELMDDLRHYNNILICGGGENECLKEVNIALEVLNKPYQILNKFIY